jgi:hypothetical protein
MTALKRPRWSAQSRTFSYVEESSRLRRTRNNAV